jgi:hypothetical protein
MTRRRLEAPGGRQRQQDVMHGVRPPAEKTDDWAWPSTAEEGRGPADSTWYQIVAALGWARPY